MYQRTITQICKRLIFDQIDSANFPKDGHQTDPTSPKYDRWLQTFSYLTTITARIVSKLPYSLVLIMKTIKTLLFILSLCVLVLVVIVALLIPDHRYEEFLIQLNKQTHSTTEQNLAVSNTGTSSIQSKAVPKATTQTPVTKAKQPPQVNTTHKAPDSAAIEVINGMDWRLPSYAKRSRLGGLASETRGPDNYVAADFHIVRWDKTNPAPGVYNFNELENAIGNRPAQQIVLRLETYSKCETPDWALRQLRHTNAGTLIFWDSQYIKLLTPYVNEVAKRFGSKAQVVGIQLGIGDGEYRGDCRNFALKDGWGEFNMTPQQLNEAQTNFGLTPQILEDSTKRIVDAYASAFARNVWKLAFNNVDQFSWEAIADPYNQRIPEIARYVLQKGLGNRDGQVEHWMRYIQQVYGMQVTPANNGTCALGMDERVADRFSKRYWGTENEFYGDLDYVRAEHGSYRNQPYRFFVSSMRALQMRRNYSLIFARGMKTLDDPVYKTQEFLSYLDKTMGKQRSDTPDAFILLGERYVADYRLPEYPQRAECRNKDSVAFRSFGRWISETSDSQPAMKIQMPASDKYWGQGFYLPTGIDYEYAARAANRFAFDLNDELTNARCLSGCSVQVKLTYKDDSRAKVWLSSATGNSGALATKGDGQIKTATFELDTTFNKQLQGHDLTVQTDGQPLSLMMLRINFLNP